MSAFMLGDPKSQQQIQKRQEEEWRMVRRRRRLNKQLADKANQEELRKGASRG